jgi:hypothetical protein
MRWRHQNRTESWVSTKWWKARDTDCTNVQEDKITRLLPKYEHNGQPRKDAEIAADVTGSQAWYEDRKENKKTKKKKQSPFIAANRNLSRLDDSVTQRTHSFIHVEFEILTAMTKGAIFWDVKPWFSAEAHRRFGRMYCLRLQGRRADTQTMTRQWIYTELNYC